MIYQHENMPPSPSPPPPPPPPPPSTPLFTLSEADELQLAKVFHNHKLFKKEAVKFGNSLFQYPAFIQRYGSPPQHEKMRADKELIKFFSSKYFLQLPKTFADSEFGVVELGTERFEIAVDYELEQWNKDRIELECKQKGVTVAVFERAYMNFNNLKRAATRAAIHTIDAFEYNGTPIKSKAVKEAVSPEVLQSTINEQFKKLTVSVFLLFSFFI